MSTENHPTKQEQQVSSQALSARPLSVPAPARVRVDSRTTVLVVMDITDPLCLNRPSCIETVPRIATFLARAREHGVAVVHTMGPKQPSSILPEVAPADGEPVIRGRADKFFGTELDDVLRAIGATTLVLVGTSANGAVLYTGFSANLRGYTVVVAVDAISADTSDAVTYSQWQLLNQPGFVNTANEPLAPERVTLSVTDLIEFD